MNVKDTQKRSYINLTKYLKMITILSTKRLTGFPFRKDTFWKVLEGGLYLN